MPRRLVDDLAQVVEPVLAREQRGVRLPPVHVRRQLARLVRRDVGRVRHDDVEALIGGERAEPIPVHERHPAREPVRRRVRARHVECALASVRGDDAGRRMLVRDRQRDAARSGAQVQHARRAHGHAPRAEELEHGFHEPLRLRARDQHATVDGRRGSERGAAGDVLDRLAGLTPRQLGLEAIARDPPPTHRPSVRPARRGRRRGAVTTAPRRRWPGSPRPRAAAWPRATPRPPCSACAEHNGPARLQPRLRLRLELR